MLEVRSSLVIPVTRRVKRYTRFVIKYVIAEGSFSDHIEHIYSWPGSIPESTWPCPSVRLTVRSYEVRNYHKFVDLFCHVHSNAFKPYKMPLPHFWKMKTFCHAHCNALKQRKTHALIFENFWIFLFSELSINTPEKLWNFLFTFSHICTGYLIAGELEYIILFFCSIAL